MKIKQKKIDLKEEKYKKTLEMHEAAIKERNRLKEKELDLKELKYKFLYGNQ